jgi:outer membrane protein OmpA-like peptidoglycan-associated protein
MDCKVDTSGVIRMRRTFGVLCATACAPLLLASGVFAQATDPQKQQAPPAASSAQSSETRPATTTFQGDTGLWYVPTGEILPDKRWSFSFYRTNQDREAGFTDISHFIGTFGYGVRDRVEIFASIQFDTRIDRDIRPLLIPGNDAGGFVNDYPGSYVDGWSGDKFGDITVGAKFNLLAEHRQQPAALALRAMVKLPTGDKDAGVSTGKADFGVDAIVSKEINKAFELSGYGGFVFRSDPDDFDISHSFRYGIGAGFPTRSPLRVTAEIVGERYFDDTITGTVGSTTYTFNNRSPLDAILGLTYIAPKGFFIGGGASYALALDKREDFAGIGPGALDYTSDFGDKVGWQLRIGYHPGVRIYVPPPPPPPPPPPVQNRPPTVKARCEPCIVEVGKSSTITADGQDPDGDTLTYKWTTPSGTIANPADRQTLWTAPMQEGTVPVTACVDDGKGGTACDTVQIQVVKPAIKEYKFEDVHFDFDRYTLRPEAARVLDEAIKAMQDNPSLRLEIEGHTCNIGTAEYNLALGERRATAVRDYLTSRGITADRLRTVSYGEERPKYDNAREETRRLNRRAAMVVRLQQ